MLLCGVLAGCVGGGFGNPADVVNIRMVNDGKLPKEQQRHYKHAFDGLFRIVKEEGPAQLMRGLGPNMNRAILMTSSQLVSYDGFKRQLLATPWFKDNLATHFASSLLAVSLGCHFSSRLYFLVFLGECVIRLILFRSNQLNKTRKTTSRTTEGGKHTSHTIPIFLSSFFFTT